MCIIIIIIIFHIYRFFPVYSADLWVSFFSFALITIFFDRLDKLFFFLFFFKFFPFFFSLYDIGLYFLLYIYVLLPLLHYSFLSPMCSTQSVRLSKDTNGPTTIPHFGVYWTHLILPRWKGIDGTMLEKGNLLIYQRPTLLSFLSPLDCQTARIENHKKLEKNKRFSSFFCKG